MTDSTAEHGGPPAPGGMIGGMPPIGVDIPCRMYGGDACPAVAG